MLVEQTKFGVPIRKHYFASASHSNWAEHLLPTAYMDCYSETKPRCFRTEHRHTLLTDLTPSEEAIFQNFPKDTRSQIRRCEQEQLFTLNLATQLELFMPLYNAFAQRRGLSGFAEEDASAIGRENYCIFSVDHQGQPAICHFYLLSPSSGVVNLLISAGHQNYSDNADLRRALGFANRCLHWQGMRHFKAAGFHTYDWGGYVVDASDPVMQGINRFKRTFNGKLTPIYNHYSPAYAFIEQMRQKLRK
ncbi:MAG: hypothetical protein HZT40_06200 [Candidatus Thiothrix singaporensis]|uniref:BioF2-like acetyltransferase domain-containing protein n=1 Tax=Candidatus Thiothrix singaporensis TaxID=2799669 RepID=A0A7L6AQC0_9GAMM|nr:MAG: hypothetical protein HZT40_06200 [Candidatus Thiothrix singaporensis]